MDLNSRSQEEYENQREKLVSGVGGLWRRASENLECYPKMGKKIFQRFWNLCQGGGDYLVRVTMPCRRRAPHAASLVRVPRRREHLRQRGLTHGGRGATSQPCPTEGSHSR